MYLQIFWRQNSPIFNFKYLLFHDKSTSKFHVLTPPPTIRSPFGPVWSNPMEAPYFMTASYKEVSNFTFAGRSREGRWIAWHRRNRIAWHRRIWIAWHRPVCPVMSITLESVQARVRYHPPHLCSLLIYTPSSVRRQPRRNRCVYRINCP